MEGKIVNKQKERKKEINLYLFTLNIDYNKIAVGLTPWFIVVL